MTTHYTIFERPVGSSVWTQVMATPNVPYRTAHAQRASDDAVSHAFKRNTCTAVVRVDLPAAHDDNVRARLADGTEYVQAEGA
jgi:hypothetical protein